MTTAETFLRANLARLPASTESWVDKGRQFTTPKPGKVALAYHLARLPAGLKYQTDELPNHSKPS